MTTEDVATGRVVKMSGRSGVVKSTSGELHPLLCDDDDTKKPGDLVQYVLKELHDKTDVKIAELR